MAENKPLSKIKKEHEGRIVAFGNGAGPVGERQDIDQLAVIAHESQNPSLLELFETLPELSELKKVKADKELKAATDGPQVPPHTGAAGSTGKNR